MPSVSVIVPVYNVQDYLVDCLESILNQTFPDLEIILVNDGSTDKSGDICDDYATRYKGRITVLHKENGGLNSARRDGFLKSRGKLITFVDSDDIIAHNFIDTLKRKLDKYGADISTTWSIGFKDIDEIKFSYTQEVADRFEKNKGVFINWLIEGGAPWGEDMYFMTAWGKLYRREIIERIDWDFSNYKANEDEFWSLQVFNNTDSGLVVTDSKLYGYRENIRSITRHTYRNEHQGRSLNKFEFILHLYEKSQAYLGPNFSGPLLHRLGFNLVDFIDIYTDKHCMSVKNSLSAQRIVSKYSNSILNNQPSDRVAKKITRMRRIGVIGYVMIRRLKKMVPPI